MFDRIGNQYTYAKLPRRVEGSGKPGAVDRASQNISTH